MLNALVKRFLDPLTNNSFILVENRIFNVKCQNPNIKITINTQVLTFSHLDFIWHLSFEI